MKNISSRSLETSLDEHIFIQASTQTHAGLTSYLLCFRSFYEQVHNLRRLSCPFPFILDCFCVLQASAIREDHLLLPAVDRPAVDRLFLAVRQVSPNDRGPDLRRAIESPKWYRIMHATIVA
jgi:hypothetical protein